MLVLLALLGGGCPSRDGKGNARVDGRALFLTACATCHGESGHAETPQGKLVGAKDLTRQAARRMGEAEMAHQIRVGKGQMPAFAGVLSDEEIDALVLEVRKLQAGAAGQEKRAR